MAAAAVVVVSTKTKTTSCAHRHGQKRTRDETDNKGFWLKRFTPRLVIAQIKSNSMQMNLSLLFRINLQVVRCSLCMHFWRAGWLVRLLNKNNRRKWNENNGTEKRCWFSRHRQSEWEEGRWLEDKWRARWEMSRQQVYFQFSTAQQKPLITMLIKQQTVECHLPSAIRVNVGVQIDEQNPKPNRIE